MRTLPRIVVALILTTLIACTGPTAIPGMPGIPAGTPTTVPGTNWTFVGGGWSFGECGERCVARVDFSAEGDAILTIRNHTNARSWTYTGVVTPAGRTLLERFSATRVDQLKRRYGCPDCADGGAGQLGWRSGSSTFETTYEYGSPPRSLRGADRFVTRVIVTLWHCDASRFVTSTRPFKACSADALT